MSRSSPPRARVCSSVGLNGSGRPRTLKFAERTASGWTMPTAAASGPGWFLSYADVPSVQRMANGTLVAQFLPTTQRSQSKPTISGRLYSKDEGKTWAAPFMPHQ